MRVCVSGASGFIGRYLCRQLKENGHSVLALVRSSDDVVADDVLFVDLGEDCLPDNALQGGDVVFHLAGTAHALSETRQDDVEYSRINTEGTRRLLEAAQQGGVPRFVFFSSVKVIGEGGDVRLSESSPCHPESPYGVSKLEAEKQVLNGGFVSEPVVLRLSMVYGDSDKGNLPRMVEAVAKNRFPPFPDIDNKRSMVHVDDVVQAAVLAAEKPEAVGNVYILTDGRIYSTRGIYLEICKALGKQVPKWKVPLFVLSALGKVGDGIGLLRGRRFVFDTDALHKLAGSAWYSSGKIQAELGFSPRHDLQSGLRGLVNFLGLK
jgi:nucleoside-diphosphate-sugar epimerase